MSFLPQEFIRAKRERQALAPSDIATFVRGMTDGSVTEGQIAAFAMAVFFNGMAREEAVSLTLAMRDSGDVLTWDDLDRPISDKHSTGGVGDNVSLMLAPIVAACGVAVPMISGRGLGHTGGTLDKMESIPGYSVMPSNALFRDTVAAAGCAIIGQTGDLAPADKRFYGIRDVTATVESIPLITASILSKKLAAGLGSLVLDVKAGNGAFMANLDDARALAQSLVAVANGAGLPTTALITAMDQPLASAAGNAVEVKNAIDFLTGAHRDPRLRDVTLALAAEMLLSAGRVKTPGDGTHMAEEALDSGRAAEIFAAMVRQLGGPADIVENPDQHLPAAPIIRPFLAEHDGTVTAMAARDIGLAVVAMGGGRVKAADGVDHAVGLTGLVSLGQAVAKGEPLAMIHARDENTTQMAEKRLRAAIAVGHDPAEAPLASIIERVSA